MWYTLALIAALATALTLNVSKKLVSKLDPFVSVFLGFGVSSLILCLILFITNGFSHITSLFFKFALVSAILDAAAYMLIFNAMKRTPVSIAAPISSFTPVFNVIFAYLILQERPTPIKLTGILTIVIGAYLLNLRRQKKYWLKPIKRLMADRGVWLILIACLIQGFSPTVQKRLIFQTMPITPMLAAFASFSMLTLILAPIALYRLRKLPAVKPDQYGLAVVYGILASIVTYCGWTAFSLTNTSYVVALSKMSIVFSVIISIVIFREKISRERWAGVAVMTLGAIALVL